MFKTRIVTPEFDIAMNSTKPEPAIDLISSCYEIKNSKMSIVDCETEDVLYSASNGRVEEVMVGVLMYLMQGIPLDE